MVDENGVDVNVAPKKSNGWILPVFICVCFLILGVIMSFVYYHEGYTKGVASVVVPNVSVNASDYQVGYDAGVRYGMNTTILGLLHYAQNCSVVRVNYSDHIYGFVDATCVVKLNSTVN